MALQEVKFRINQETGEVEVKTDGFNGKGCDAVHDLFNNALGGTEVKTHTPEFHRPVLQNNKIKQGM